MIGPVDTFITEIPENEGSWHCYSVTFTPDKHAFQNGMDTGPVLRNLRALGACLVVSQCEDLPKFQDIDPEKSYLQWQVLLHTNVSPKHIEDIFTFVSDDWDITFALINDESIDSLTENMKHWLEKQITKQNALSSPLNTAPNPLSESPLLGTDQIKQPLPQTKPDTPTKTKQSKQDTTPKNTIEQNDPTIKVPSSRLDNLMNLVGELVIVQARLNQVSARDNNEDIMSIAEELDLLTTQMRDQTFSIRMLPIGSTFARFKRLVRDLSGELNKKIHLVTFGAETELDKMVIDKLGDPLVHLIRHSIDHGIETPEERIALGKTESGLISFSAEHSDSYVIITIKDDGKGLDLPKIHAKALANQLIKQEDELGDEALQQLIFEPGFSTSDTVTDLSGRGVGMDVVKRSIQELGGQIDIQSGHNIGTEFTIRLPMTLAIIEGLLVVVGDEHYVLPLSCVEECIEMPPSLRAKHTQNKLVETRGKQIPYLILREWFEAPGERPAIEQIVIVHVGNEQFGLCVDEVVGQYQTVVKRLGRVYEDAVGFSGATILGDGSVAMILDPSSLIEAADQEHTTTLSTQN
ncbi:chemotaxis protein CheA [Marinomonas sp. IMCC 4694]|uniref:chemotaxis protein CheA n=1 Tax=Marinomonas sp. IMCC 4694 TaxID=2605432 RepID=UPI0011E69496|nr:chemotaxis protein CheA [Marinomonas sp. IMCC 4694]TYL47592.1 chemotaxis protein CheA [Marinomonas sp. IMCC 4694]